MLERFVFPHEEVLTFGGNYNNEMITNATRVVQIKNDNQHSMMKNLKMQ